VARGTLSHIHTAQIGLGDTTTLLGWPEGLCHSYSHRSARLGQYNYKSRVARGTLSLIFTTLKQDWVIQQGWPEEHSLSYSQRSGLARGTLSIIFTLLR
jgi:hypothetical protein